MTFFTTLYLLFFNSTFFILTVKFFLILTDVAWLDYIEANSSADGMEIEKSMEQHVYRLAGNQSDEEQMNPLNGPLNMFPASGTKSDFFGSL